MRNKQIHVYLSLNEVIAKTADTHYARKALPKRRKDYALTSLIFWMLPPPFIADLNDTDWVQVHL